MHRTVQNFPIVAAALGALLCLSATTPVMADVTGGATAFCQAALPAYEGQVRKRPLGLQNEGAATAFITCNVVSTRLPTGINVYMSSLDARPKTVTCTAILGTGNSAAFATKSVNYTGASIEMGAMTFFPQAFGRTAMDRIVSLSCSLPPGAALHQLILLQPE